MRETDILLMLAHAVPLNLRWLRSVRTNQMQNAECGMRISEGIVLGTLSG